MTIPYDQLAKDLCLLDSAALARRYKGQIPAGIRIADLVASLKRQNLLETAIRSDWKGDGSDKDGIYLLRCDTGYELFNCERGVKHWVEKFDDLESAGRAWVDALLNELLYLAPDSTIG